MSAETLTLALLQCGPALWSLGTGRWAVVKVYWCGDPAFYITHACWLVVVGLHHLSNTEAVHRL